MTRAALLAAALLLAGCDRAVAPDTASDPRIAAAERRAVADTDAARREMAVPPPTVVTVRDVRPAAAATVESQGSATEPGTN